MIVGAAGATGHPGRTSPALARQPPAAALQRQAETASPASSASRRASHTQWRFQLTGDTSKPVSAHVSQPAGREPAAAAFRRRV